MRRILRDGRPLAALSLCAVAVLVLADLSGFGIWDPWELSVADRARELAAGKAGEAERPVLSTWLVAVGFELFGIYGWAGRLPVALAGVLTAGLAYALLARFADRRAGAYAALVSATCPLLLFNARQMMGDAVTFAVQGLIGLTAAAAVFLPTCQPDVSERRVRIATGIWLAALLAAIAVGILARGALVAALPPVLAVACTAALQGTLLRPRSEPRRFVAACTVSAIAAVLTLQVARAIVADRAGYSPWLGGHPKGGQPPTFDAVLGHVFHGFVPWSALLLPALGRMLWPAADDAKVDAGDSRAESADPDGATTSDAEVDLGSPRAVPDGDAAAPARIPLARPEESSLRLVLLLWIAFAYGALMLFLARYGEAPFVAVVPLAGTVALFLRDVERSERAWWATGVVLLLFVVLAVRDYGLYPKAPMHALALDKLQVPDVFNPVRAWGVVLALFLATGLLALGVPPRDGRLDLRAPYRWVRDRWGAGRPFRAWLVFTGAVLTFMVLFGGVCWVMGTSLALNTIFVEAGRKLFFVALLLPVAVGVGQLVLYGFGRLGKWRLAPLFVAGLAVGAYTAHGFLPAVSAHFSPREVYDIYNEWASEGEPLAEYQVGSRAAAYYANTSIQELDNRRSLIDYLIAQERRWAIFPAGQLAEIDHDFRERTGRHVFVPKAPSARVVLVSNQPLDDRPNRSFLAGAVLDQLPSVQHRVGARFEDRVELVGYDLELPHEGYAGVGESFRITWYWRCLKDVTGSWKIFVHIDRGSQRIHGDHHAVDGDYPTRLWEKGDVIADRQTIEVPPYQRPGTYTIYMGLYRGDRRMQVVEGPSDNHDRVRAGRLRIR